MAIEIIEADDGLSYRLPLQSTFTMPSLAPEYKKSDPAQHFEHALNGLDGMLMTIEAVKADPELSELGRTRKIEPKQAEVVEVIANRWDAIAAEERKLHNREEAMFAPPKLDPSHSAMAIEEREIRDWWRSLSLEDRTKMLGQIESRPGHERLMIALLRSPIPNIMGEREVKVVGDVWKRTKRLDNPDEAAAIEAGLLVTDWARRGLANVAGVAKQHLRDWSTERILRQVLSSQNPFTQRGAGAWGFDPVQVSTMRQRLALQSAA